jgi:multiple sugar transport system permease protein
MTVTPTKPAETLAPAKGAKTMPARGKRTNRKQLLAIWLFLAPAAVLGLYFKFIPMVEGIRLSLFKVQPFLGDVFVGFDNYIRVLTDARFMEALGHTVVLGLTQTLGALVVGFVLALLLEGQSRSLWVLRTAIFLPVVTALAAVGK